MFWLLANLTSVQTITVPATINSVAAVGTLASTVSICNAAFAYLGLKAVNDLDETSPRATQARLEFQATVDEVIVDHAWKCSLTRARLARLSTAPLFDYQQAFALPTDPYCLKVWGTNLDRWVGGDLALVDVLGAGTVAERPRWKVEGRTLLTDDDSIDILYGFRLMDPNQFDPGLKAAVILKLASKWAYPLTGKAPLAQDLRKLYEIELARAKGSDSQQRSPRSAPSRTLGAVR